MSITTAHPTGGGAHVSGGGGASSRWVKSEVILPPKPSAAPQKKSPRAAPPAPGAPAAAPSAAPAAISQPPPATDTPPRPAPAESPADAVFHEARVALSLGLPRGRIRALRRAHLATPADYYGREGAIVFTAPGLDRLMALVAPRADTPPPAVPAGPPERAALVVVRVPSNPRLLLCRLPDGHPDAPPPFSAAPPRPVTVRVRDNTHFIPGMALPCIAGAFGVWQHVGRLPRRRGKW